MSAPVNKQLQAVARKAMDGALKRGVKGARVSAFRSRNVAVTYRQGRPDKVSESSRQSLSLYLYLDGRYTACETNDLRGDAVERFLDSSVAMCKAMTPDEFRVMPDPALYEGRKELDLGIFDDGITAVTPSWRHDYASHLEEATKQAAGEGLISAEASYDDTDAEIYQVHSNGFEGTKRGTQYWSFAETSLQDEGDKRPSGWSVAGSRTRAGLASPEEVGKRSAKTALARMGAAQIETQKLPMIVENRTVRRLLGRLMGATSGRALQQKTTFLEGMVGEKFGSEHLDIVDDPFVPGGFGSRLFDSEGIAARPLPVFEKGVLRNFYIDTYYGKKLGLPPTTGRSSNLVVAPGTRGLDDLIGDLDKGILVRGFIGGNSNSTTGDFSMGVYGTLIEKGKLTRAVSEMNIAGNHKELWNRLAAVGNDPYVYSTYRSPSLLFDEIQFSGA